MVQTFTGKNAFLLSSALSKTINKFEIEAGRFAVERIDASETEFDNIIQSVQSLPFISPQKLVIITSLQANKVMMERIEELIERVADGVDVILVDPNLDKRKSSYKLLQKHTKLTEFSDLDFRGLTIWIAKYSEEQDAKMDSRTAQYLLERVGANQQQLAREIEKLALYDKEITKSTINELTEASVQSTIFNLLEAVFSRNINRAMKLYEEQRSAQIDPHYIIAMFTWQLQNLAQAVYDDTKTESSLVAAGQSPYTARKSLQLARHVSKARVKKMIIELSELDAESKKSVDVDEALKLYILSV
jgi:DNA polymerase III subunit delta